MLYDDIVQLSKRLSATSKRTAKVADIALLLQRTPVTLTRVVVGMLVGEPTQGRFGVGWATVRDARVDTAVTPTVSVAEIDSLFSQLAAASGTGSQQMRESTLRSLFVRLTDEEQDHLIRLLTGELRQGRMTELLVMLQQKQRVLPPPTFVGQRCFSVTSAPPWSGR